MINIATNKHIQVAKDPTNDLKAQATMVDNLFEIDSEGYIKQEFIRLFQQDSKGLKANV